MKIVKVCLLSGQDIKNCKFPLTPLINTPAATHEEACLLNSNAVLHAVQ